jgi:signal transduction histidine kinase
MKEQSKKVNRARGGQDTRKTTITQLKEENRQLRQEIARLQGSHPGVLTNSDHLPTLRNRAEQFLSGQAAQMHDLSSEDEKGLIHGLQVQQVELELRIAERTIDLAHANQMLEVYVKELEDIRNILSVLTTHLDLPVILDHVLEGAMELTGMESGTLCLVNHNQEVLTLSAARNISPEMDHDLSTEAVKLGSCLCGNAARTGEPFILWDNASGSEYATFEAVRNEGIRFHAAFPMMVKGNSIGVLCIFSRSQTRPTQHSLNLLRDLCGPIGLAIENTLLFEEVRREAAHSHAIAQTAAQISARLDLETVLNTVCQEAARALDVPAANIFLYDEQLNELIFTADFGFPTNFRQRHPPLPRIAFDKLIVRFGSSGIVEDMQAISGFPNAELYAEQDLHSVMLVSIFHNQSLIGLLNVFSRGELRHFKKDDLALLQVLADQAAQAIVNARLYEQVSAGRKHLLVLSKQLVEVQEAERRALALELHDEFGQMLSSIKMSLGMVSTLPEMEAHQQLQRAKTLVSDLVNRVRRRSLELRPSLLDDMGLLQALFWLFENYQTQTGEPVEFEYAALEQRFSPMVEITAYRIVQEAMTNVIRHARNKHIYVNVWANEHDLNLQIMDRGGGFDLGTVLSKRTSSGLSGMRERARLLGGDLVIESEIGAGTCLTARLPLGSNPKCD